MQGVARFRGVQCRVAVVAAVPSLGLPHPSFAMSRLVRSTALTAAKMSLRANSPLTFSLSSSSPRLSSLPSLSALSPSIFLVPVRTAVNAPQMTRPSASSPPSSLKKSRSSAPAQRVTNPKKTTWITGLDVVPNAPEVLLSLYEETLRKVESYDVKDAYNAHLIQLVKYRQSIVQRESEVEAIEAAINCGQIEELIEQAEDEFDLLVAMNETIRPWEDDKEGDDAFTEYHPSYGQEKAHFIVEPTADEQKAFDAFDQQQGGGAAAGAGSGAGASAGAATGGAGGAAAGGATATATQQPTASGAAAPKA